MEYKKKQEQIEEKTYDIIHNLADEFNLKTDPLPEVYWVGRKLNFEDLGLDETERDEFDSIKRIKGGAYFYRPNIILTCSKKRGVLGEEAGHYLHFKNSRINLEKSQLENKIDYQSKIIIAEALGFFCAKLVCYKREDFTKPYSSFKDFVIKNLNKKGIDTNFLDKKTLEDKIFENSELIGDEFFIYKRGYNLGDELFNHYLSGNLSKRQVKNLFKNSFDEDFSATKKLLRLIKKYT